MSSSKYTKISQLDKLTVNDLKSNTGILKLPVLITEAKSIDLISNETGKAIITPGLGENYIIDIFFKANKNITFSFDKLGLYWDGRVDFETDDRIPYAAITVNESPSEIYKLVLTENGEPADVRSEGLLFCDWNLESSQYKKIINKVSICLFCTINTASIDQRQKYYTHELINNNIGKIKLSESLLRNADLIMINLPEVGRLTIDENITANNTNLSVKYDSHYIEITPIGNLPISCKADQVNFTNNLNTNTFFEGKNVKTVQSNRTTKINNGIFINTKVQSDTLDNIFENYEILKESY